MTKCWHCGIMIPQDQVSRRWVESRKNHGTSASSRGALRIYSSSSQSKQSLCLDCDEIYESQNINGLSYVEIIIVIVEIIVIILCITGYCKLTNMKSVSNPVHKEISNVNRIESNLKLSKINITSPVANKVMFLSPIEKKEAYQDKIERFKLNSMNLSKDPKGCWTTLECNGELYNGKILSVNSNNVTIGVRIKKMQTLLITPLILDKKGLSKGSRMLCYPVDY